MTVLPGVVLLAVRAARDGDPEVFSAEKKKYIYFFTFWRFHRYYHKIILTQINERLTNVVVETLVNSCTGPHVLDLMYLMYCPCSKLYVYLRLFMPIPVQVTVPLSFQPV